MFFFCFCFFLRAHGRALTTMKHCNKHCSLPEEAALSAYLMNKRPKCRLGKEAWRGRVIICYGHMTTIQWGDDSVDSNSQIIWILELEIWKRLHTSQWETVCINCKWIALGYLGVLVRQLKHTTELWCALGCWVTDRKEQTAWLLT